MPSDPNFRNDTPAFSKHHAKANELLKTFSEKLKAMKKSGKLSDILAKYGLKMWEE